MRAASPQYGALVPDLPGHGGSADRPWQSLARTSAVVAKVVDALPADRPIYITGHSLGAYIGWVMATGRPERFAGAVLSSFHLGDIKNQTLLKLAYVANSLMFVSPPLLRCFASFLGDAGVAARFVEGAKVIWPSTVRRAGIQVVEFQSRSGFEAPPMPITAVAGDHEPEPIRSTPGRLAARNSHVRAVLLRGRGHLWPITEPQTYADVLSQHMYACELAAAADGSP